jgi:hypothetical protein
MVAQMPTMAGIRTIYASIGDLFVWLWVIGLLGNIGWVAISFLWH